MRIYLALLLGLLAVPASAQEWGQYDNARYGYSLPIPPAFEGNGESDNGDGQVFTSKRHNEILTVWASYGSGNFAMDALAAGNDLGDDAWHVGTQVIRPQDARFSAVKGIRTLRQHMVQLCNGEGIAYIRLDYPVTASADMESVFKQLVRGFDSGEC